MRLIGKVSNGNMIMITEKGGRVIKLARKKPVAVQEERIDLFVDLLFSKDARAKRRVNEMRKRAGLEVK